MTPPSGDQHELTHGGYRAVVTEGGATLRSLSYDGRDLVQGFPEDRMPSGGRGQVLMPWPNRIRDGAYTFDGTSQQLPLSEPGRHNASHGLVRWVSWSAAEGDASSVTLRYRLMAQTGYPWTLDVACRYALDDDGLAVRMTATNLDAGAAPFACGAHPYLVTGSAHVDDDTLTLPGSTRLLTDDERKLPTGSEPVAGSSYDFRKGHPIGETVLDHAFTDLARDADGRARVVLRSPAGSGVELWVDGRFGWVQVYSGDDQAPDTARTALAVEPMTAPPDAFNSGDDLVVLEPGATFSATWGIRALD